MFPNLYQNFIGPAPALEEYKADFCGAIQKALTSAGYLEFFPLVVRENSYAPYVLTSMLWKSDDGFGYLCYKQNPANPADKTNKLYIKGVSSFQFKNERIVDRLFQELCILKRLEASSYCITLQDCFICKVSGGYQFCMVHEPFDGINLDKFLVDNKAGLNAEQINLVLWNLACALKDIHSNGIVHRDINPKNITLMLEGTQIIDVKLPDFGLGKVLTEEGVTGTAIGETDYTAPEILKGEKYDSKADLWSFGSLMYLLLFKVKLYSSAGNNVADVRAGKPIKLPAVVNMPDYIDLMSSCLTLNPTFRYGINDVLAHRYFSTVSIPVRKSMAPYKLTGESFTILSNTLLHCTKSGLKKPFVAKQIYGGTLTSPSVTKTLCAELSSMVKVRNCSNTVKLYDYFFYNNDVYMIMDYISNTTLKQYIYKVFNKINPDERKQLVLEIVKAIKDIHAHKVCHRGISPNSVYVAVDPATLKFKDVRLADFGRSKIMINEDPTMTAFYDNYAAPEIAVPGYVPSPSADIWSLGILIYFIAAACDPLDVPGNDLISLRSGKVKPPKNAKDLELLNLAYSCLKVEPTMRPTAENIHDYLNAQLHPAIAKK